MGILWVPMGIPIEIFKGVLEYRSSSNTLSNGLEARWCIDT